MATAVEAALDMTFPFSCHGGQGRAALDSIIHSVCSLFFFFIEQMQRKMELSYRLVRNSRSLVRFSPAALEKLLEWCLDSKRLKKASESFQ